MTSDQARKLLGGYATNSLTEAERTALFEAALDDQELFDALQQEEALKGLLADPTSRSQVQQALAKAPISRPRPGWLWGGLAGAVAAAVLMVAVIRSNQQPKYQAARVAPSAAAPIPMEPVTPAVPAPAQPKPRKLPSATRKAVQTDRELQPPAAALPAPPPPPQPAPAAVPQMQSFRQEDVARARGVSALSVGTGGVIADVKAPLLQYSLVKRDLEGTYSVPNARPQPGDLVRLRILTAVAGYLSLYQLDPSGGSKRMFPAADQGLLVAPNVAAIIPDSAIIVTDTDQKFRLTLVRADTQAAAAPLTVDVTIGPGKAP